MKLKFNQPEDKQNIQIFFFVKYFMDTEKNLLLP